MLTMDDIKYIRRMYEKEGCSIREIMKRTGYHYETVSKYLDMEDFNLPIYRTDKKPSRLDPLKPVIDQWLKDDMKAPRKQRHTAKRVYDRLVAEYPEEIGVRLRTVQYYVNEKKKDLYSNRSRVICRSNIRQGKRRLISANLHTMMNAAGRGQDTNLHCHFRRATRHTARYSKEKTKNACCRE